MTKPNKKKLDSNHPTIVSTFSQETLISLLQSYPKTMELYSQQRNQKRPSLTMDSSGLSSLQDLDHWVWNVYPSIILSKQNGGFLNLLELITLVRWKLSRGTFRPNLLQLISSNTESEIQKITHSAIQNQSLSKLCLLKGIGPATATAILAPLFPTRFVFFSDPLVHFFNNNTTTNPKISYTFPFYTSLLENVLNEIHNRNQQQLDGKQGCCWTLEQIEKVAWCWEISNRFKEPAMMMTMTTTKRKIKQDTSISSEQVESNPSSSSTASSSVVRRSKRIRSKE